MEKSFNGRLKKLQPTVKKASSGMGKEVSPVKKLQPWRKKLQPAVKKASNSIGGKSFNWHIHSMEKASSSTVVLRRRQHGVATTERGGGCVLQSKVLPRAAADERGRRTSRGPAGRATMGALQRAVPRRQKRLQPVAMAARHSLSPVRKSEHLRRRKRGECES